jgi:hypothetical protein
MNPREPRVVIPDTTKRDALVAVGAGLLMLAFIFYGIVHFAHLSSRAKANILTGTIVEKQFKQAPEQQITVGHKGLKSEETDGEYLLGVRVDSEAGRTFDVPVEKDVYEGKKVGDPLTFLRPASERQ